MQRSRSWVGPVGLVWVVGTVAAAVWFDHRLAAVGRDDLAAYAGSGWMFGAALVAIAFVATLVVQRSQHLAAVFLLVAAASVSSALLASSYAGLGLIADPGSVPGARWVAPWSGLLFLGAYPFVAAALLVTPTGSPQSARWAKVLAVVLIADVLWLVGGLFGSEPSARPFEEFASPYQIPSLAVPLDVATGLGVFLTLFGVLAAIGSVAVSYRRATGDRRQQMRWFLFGVAVAAVAVGGAIVSAALGSTIARDGLIAVAIVAFACGLSVAVAKFRLYELDLIVNRSVVYATVTAGLLAVYVASIGLVGMLLGDSPASAGIAAIAVAVSVAPIRRMTERLIGRTVFGTSADRFGLVSELHRALQHAPAPQSALDAFVRLVAEGMRVPYVSIDDLNGRPLAAHGTVTRDGSNGSNVEVPLDHQGERLGRLVVGLPADEPELSPRRRELVDDLGRLASQTVRTALLISDVRRSRQRIVTAQQEERRRLRRDLHDGLGPRLTGVALKSDAAANLIDDDSDRAAELMHQVSQETRAVIGEVRRLVYDLRPPSLDELGLANAIRDDAARLRLGEHTSIDVIAGELGQLPAAVEIAAYRIATEAITNATRHGHANSCQVRLAVNGRLELTIDDDGDGLRAGWRPGVGVLSMRERAEEVGGTCDIGSRDARGVRVRAILPMEQQ